MVWINLSLRIYVLNQHWIGKHPMRWFIYTLYDILITIKQIGTYTMVPSRGILLKSESISRLPMKYLLSWCVVYSAKAKESFTVNSLNVIEVSLGTKNFASL